MKHSLSFHDMNEKDSLKVLDLSRLEWQLRGWRPFAWYMRTSMEIGVQFNSDIPSLPAKVPGSVQAALLAGAWIKDWNCGLNSLNCEWVEHRHWEFYTEIAGGSIPEGKPVMLYADGLDYSGWILVDNRRVATFQGALLRHSFDLSAFLNDGKPHGLSIVFDEPPPEQGQIGFTSKSRYFKPRYNYSWDWCPRLVPVGIWDRLYLECGKRELSLVKLLSRMETPGQGILDIELLSAEDETSCEVSVRDDRSELARKTFNLHAGENKITVSVEGVKAWWPNGEGAQELYTVEVHAGGQAAISLRTGFKTIRWLPCASGPKDALPWICEVNGKPLFLKGVNWTPIRLDYHSVTEEQYLHLLGLYRDMGCNLLRVWGGAYLERESFFRLCDEMGLMVWQEFPLSSSGPDNWPPEDPQAIGTIEKIAVDYIRRRAHHACKLLWCGGNELQHEEGKDTGTGIPMTEEHPCLAALGRIVHREDPGTRYLPTSSSGPRFMADAKDFGKGLHHDVHGPWNMDADMGAYQKYWDGDDALFRSETGMPSASSIGIFDRYAGDCNPWPPSSGNPYWLHTGAWWLQWKRFQGGLAGKTGREGLIEFIGLSQKLQAEALGVAAKACRDRFPSCGGFLLWMGHDSYPCSANTAVIDFEGNPKPAYFVLQGIFKNLAL